MSIIIIVIIIIIIVIILIIMLKAKTGETFSKENLVFYKWSLV